MKTKRKNSSDPLNFVGTNAKHMIDLDSIGSNGGNVIDCYCERKGVNQTLKATKNPMNLLYTCSLPKVAECLPQFVSLFLLFLCFCTSW